MYQRLKQSKYFYSVLTIIFYAIIASFVYVSLNKDVIDVRVIDKNGDNDFEEKPAKAFFQVDNGRYVVKYDSVRLKNTNNIRDLLEHHRKNSSFTYEKVDYSYGNVFTEVNGEILDGTWVIFSEESGAEYEHTLSDRLLHNNTYTLKLIPLLIP